MTGESWGVPDGRANLHYNTIHWCSYRRVVIWTQEEVWAWMIWSGSCSLIMPPLLLLHSFPSVACLLSCVVVAERWVWACTCTCVSEFSAKNILLVNMTGNIWVGGNTLPLMSRMLKTHHISNSSRGKTFQMEMCKSNFKQQFLWKIQYRKIKKIHEPILPSIIRTSTQSMRILTARWPGLALVLSLSSMWPTYW